MWTNVIAIFIVVAAAATIGVVGGTITSAADAAKALEPVAGRLAEALFAVGLFGASVLAATIMPLSTAFVICEAFGWESGVDKRFSDARAFFSIYTFVLAAGALVVLIPGLDLLPVIIASQNLQGLLLPVVLVFMVLLVNDARLMGAHRNGRIGNVLAWSAVGLVIVLDVVLLPGLDLLPVIVASQNLQGLLLPVVLVFMVLLVNDARLMGEHRNGRIGNLLAWSAIGLIIVLDVVLLGVAALGAVGVHVG